MPAQVLVPENQLLTKGIQIGKSQINRLIAAGKFPKPVHVTARRRAFVESELEDYIKAKIAERDASAA